MSTSNETTLEVTTTQPMFSGWKIDLRLTIGLLLLTLLSSYLYFQLLQQQYEKLRQFTSINDRQLIEQIQTSSSQQLKQLSSLIAAQQNIMQALATGNSQQLSAILDPFGEQLLSHKNIDYLAFYTAKQQPLVIWTDKTSDRGLAQQINQWLKQTDLSGSSQPFFSCLNECRHYQVMPLTLNQQKIGYLVLSSSFSQSLNQLGLPETRIISILTPAQDRATSTDTMVYKWGYRLHTSTDTVRGEKILQQFSKKYASLISDQAALFSYSFQRVYQLTLYPVQHTEDTFLIILDDMTDSLFPLIRSCLIFAFSFFSALMLMQLFLKRPQRSRSVTSALVQNQPHENVANIHQQLEILKHYNEDINRELAQQMIRLKWEKGMLDTVRQHTQAIIMTLHCDGRILSSNSHLEKISGYTEAELNRKKFTDLYPENSPGSSGIRGKFAAISSGKISDFQHEATLKPKEKSSCMILWQHTRLPADHNEKALILTTGIDITGIKKLEKNLSWLINYDALTSLFNRRRFENELDAALLWAKNNNGDGTLLTIDLDNFKDINDSCGHKVGDIILRKVASTIKIMTREFFNSSNIISARLGGDEFAIILRNIDQDGAIQLARRIIKALNNISHMQRQISFQLSSSIGIATFSGAENIPNDLLSNANFARNQAKIEGRNQYHTFKAEHSHLEKTHYRMFWREKIENALKTDGFILHFQPILNIHHSTISHYETLLRMSNDNNELVTPALFIDIAEKFGLIQQIDSFIIAAAIAKQGALRRSGHDVTLAINLSSKAFDDPELFNKINSAINTSHANPEHLIFEITETGEVSNIVEAKGIMTRIQALGCKFSLDDFGIGFSSFYHLRKLPFEYVKIDGSFINDLANNSDNQILVQALSEVAIGFNKLTVAEFVDSRQTLEILKQAKVNYAQGYLIGKPSAKIPVEAPGFFKSGHH